MNKPKIYISGKITGLSKEDVFKKFKLHEDRIYKEGKYEPVNPLRLHGIHTLEDYINHKPKPYLYYLKEDIRGLLDCHAICMLPCWQDSRGAIVEHNIARDLEFEMVYL